MVQMYSNKTVEGDITVKLVSRVAVLAAAGQVLSGTMKEVLIGLLTKRPELADGALPDHDQSEWIVMRLQQAMIAAACECLKANAMGFPPRFERELLTTLEEATAGFAAPERSQA